jgi:hypothetical protein
MIAISAEEVVETVVRTVRTATLTCDWCGLVVKVGGEGGAGPADAAPWFALTRVGQLNAGPEAKAKVFDSGACLRSWVNAQ